MVFVPFASLTLQSSKIFFFRFFTIHKTLAQKVPQYTSRDFPKPITSTPVHPTLVPDLGCQDIALRTQVPISHGRDKQPCGRCVTAASSGSHCGGFYDRRCRQKDAKPGSYARSQGYTFEALSEGDQSTLHASLRPQPVLSFEPVSCQPRPQRARPCTVRVDVLYWAAVNALACIFACHWQRTLRETARTRPYGHSAHNRYRGFKGKPDR